MVLHIGGRVKVGFITHHHNLIRCVVVIAISLSGHAFKQRLKVSYLDHFADTVLVFDDGAQLHANLQVDLLLNTSLRLFHAGAVLLVTLRSCKQAYLPSLVRKLMVHDLGNVTGVRYQIIRLVNIIVLLQQLLERLVGIQVVFV